MQNTNSPQVDSPNLEPKLTPNPQTFKSPKNTLLALIFAIIFIASLLYLLPGFLKQINPPKDSGIQDNLVENTKPTIEKFKSVEEFKEYITTSNLTYDSGFGSGLMSFSSPSMSLNSAGSALKISPGENYNPERVSETNIQVKGIDEPDIVKTDGKSIFLSNLNPTYTTYTRLPSYYEDVGQNQESKILGAFPPTNLSLQSKVGASGELLLRNNKLIVLSGSKIQAFDVTDRLSPVLSWTFELDNKNQILTSRLFENKIYLVTTQLMNFDEPCPIPLGKLQGSVINIDCVDIYHPRDPISFDTTYSIFTLNPDNGVVDRKVSFVGSYSQSVVYMSPTSIYLTYSNPKSFVTFFTNFLKEKTTDLFPQEIIQKVDRLNNYDISESGKFSELFLILERYRSSISKEEQERYTEEITSRLEKYSDEHIREYTKSGIIKVSNQTLEVTALGEISGFPLNQFSLDEYQGFLRIATTISDNSTGFFDISSSKNDLYVLDDKLNVVSSILDLGLTEKIYSARFVEDKGYLVTFRRIDPFYVFDLSDPTNPKKTGELKIPGFSSYLHPINKNLVLGVGNENATVKVSLFDVSDPTNPIEKSKFALGDYWSEVSQNYHAFLLDDKHKVFFLPAGSEGYIFSYTSDTINLVKKVEGVSAKRAIYIDDFLYVIGDTKLVVFHENDWSQVGELTY